MDGNIRLNITLPLELYNKMIDLGVVVASTSQGAHRGASKFVSKCVSRMLCDYDLFGDGGLLPGKFPWKEGR
jgi:hypothetical protein